jgi:hypothetical protein
VFGKSMRQEKQNYRKQIEWCKPSLVRSGCFPGIRTFVFW